MNLPLYTSSQRSNLSITEGNCPVIITLAPHRQAFFLDQENQNKNKCYKYSLIHFRQQTVATESFEKDIAL